MWGSEYALALDLFALGRVFLFKVVHRSAFSAELVPYRVCGTNGVPAPLPRAPVNPELGRGVCEMLTRALMCAGKRDWANAQAWCDAALRVRDLGALYRGGVDVTLAGAVVEFYCGAVNVGKQEWDSAYANLTACAEQLAFTFPDRAAAAWLALARLYCFQNNAPDALWSLQKCEGVVADIASPAREILLPLVTAEYARLNLYFKI
jgi:hypothetical protein